MIPPALTIDDILPGRLYSTGSAAAIFSRSNEWVRLRCKAGWFAGASQLGGTSHWMIPGSAIRERYGEKLIAAERKAAVKAEPTPAQMDRQTRADLDRLAEFEASLKPPKKATNPKARR